jgi:aminopeptidase N
MKEYSEHAVEEVSEEEAAQFVTWEQIVSDRSALMKYRILADFLEPSSEPFFLAELRGEKAGWFEVAYDPRLVEEVTILKFRDTPLGSVADLWASFNRRSEARNPEAVAHENKSVVDVVSYDIDATISDTQLDATATMRLKTVKAGARVLTFDISRFLRVSSVSLDSGDPVPFYQYAGNTLTVVLQSATVPGQEMTLRLAYSGEVLAKRGTGMFYVGERGLWYPGPGGQDGAAFNLTFHYPAAYTLVATGSKVREWDEAGRRHAIWKSDGEFPIAGFNLGDFTIVGDEASPLPIYVCVNSDVGAENLLKDLRATVTYFSGLFGPYPYSRLTVSPFPVGYPQSWPALVGLQSESQFLVTELARTHELAHQWFGNKVGWSSYRDQWIAEGFAHYAGAMYMENKYPDTSRFREILDEARTQLLEQGADGSIWLGQRLASTSTPNGYTQTLPNKATWVVHMLRILMREDGPNPDAAFLKMTREFLEGYQGKLASTWDFKRIAEKYMTKSMDLRDDMKLDWFFDEWVFGTGIPTYTLDYSVQPAQNGFIVQGTIKQSEVSEHFIMSVPIYADGDFLGRVVVSDEDGTFRFSVKNRPAKVVIDPQGTILAKVVN